MERIGAIAVLLGLVSCACAGATACEKRSDGLCAAEPSPLLQLQKDESGSPEAFSLLQRRQDRSGALSRNTPPQFSVQSITLGEEGGESVGLKVLQNSVTGESVDIAWTFGGKVDALRLRSPVTGKVRDVLKSSGRNATKLLTMGWGVNEFLIPFANRIENGTYRDTVTGDLHYMKRTNHMPSGDNAIHGFLIGKTMDVVSEHQGSDYASVTLAYTFNSANDEATMTKGYPYPLSVNITYTLDGQGLTVTVAAKNEQEDGLPLPFYMGMHPYFEVSDVSKSSVLLDTCTGWNQIEVDENLIPTGKTFPFDGFSGKPMGGSTQAPAAWDNGFKALASSAACGVLRTEVYDPSVGDSSVLWMNSPEFKWLQIFTGGTPLLGQVIAVEPMSGETDAFNNEQSEMLILQAGDRWEGSFGFKVVEPSAAVVG